MRCVESREPESGPASRSGFVARTISRAREKAENATAWVLGARESHSSVDVGFRTADRDRRVAAGVLAGGVAYRIFFWMLAASLLVNGTLGFVDGSRVREALRAEGLDPSVAASLQAATHPSDTARWWLLIAGIWLVLWTGYIGAQSLVRVYAAVWDLPPPPIRRVLVASAAFTGTVLAFVVTMAVAQWLRTRAPGPGLGVSLAVVVVVFVLWLVVSGWLPHRDAGWLGLAPGALLVAVGVQAMHLFSAFLLGPKLTNATELYGVIGVVATILFWLYIVGRLVIGGATINVSVHEHRFGSTEVANL
jgi:uncharacterized BrkB/YihY/UPF0761 family membrane protein